MSNLNLETSKHGRMTIVPTVEGDALHVKIEGIGDSFAVKGLGLFLKRATEEMGRLGIARATIDISQVSLLSSSCIKQFITFLRPIKAGDVDCQVEFRVAAEVPWQRRSISALVRMCQNRVSLSSNGQDNGQNPSRKLSYAKPVSVTPGAN